MEDLQYNYDFDCYDDDDDDEGYDDDDDEDDVYLDEMMELQANNDVFVAAKSD